MKRSALILLTAIYLLSCVGIGVSRFYCCGKLASVTLTYAAQDHTGDKGNCCKHESKSFKLKDSHVTANALVLNQLMPAILPVPVYLTALEQTAEQVTQTKYRANAPPDNPAVPIYTINCAYRI
jgi:hypothetical protein